MSVQTSPSRPAAKSIGAAFVDIMLTLLIFVVVLPGVPDRAPARPGRRATWSTPSCARAAGRRRPHRAARPRARRPRPTASEQGPPHDHDAQLGPTQRSPRLHRRRRPGPAAPDPRGHLPHLPGDAVRRRRRHRAGRRRRRRRLRSPRTSWPSGSTARSCWCATRSTRSSPAIDAVYPPQETEVETPEARRARMQMAQMLTRSGLITDEQLQRAMLEYSRTGDPLGDILVSHEAITEDVLVAALSEMYQMQRVGLSDFDARPARSPAGCPSRSRRATRRCRSPRPTDLVLLAVARPLDAEAAAEVEEALGCPFRQLLANRTELDQLIQRVHARHYAEVSTRLLMETRPDESAHIVVSGGQKAVLVITAHRARRLRRDLADQDRDRPRRRLQPALPGRVVLQVPADAARARHPPRDRRHRRGDRRSRRAAPAGLHDPGAALQGGRRSCRAWCATSTRSTTRAPAST